MDIRRSLARVDAFQQRRRPLALIVAVVRKYGDDQGGDLVAVISYTAFLSLFPLLLVFTTLLGYVLHGHPAAQSAVIHSVLGQLPVVGDAINARALRGNAFALVIGLLGSLWGGLRVTLAVQTAFDRVWSVPRARRRSFVGARLHGLGVLAALGVLNLASTAAAGIVAGGLGGPALLVAGVAVSLALNVLLFFAAFRLLTDDAVPTRDLVAAIVTATLLWEILQVLGGYFVGHAVRSASPAYGTFALVIGLIAWLHLGAQTVVYAAEVSVVRARRLWPRSLLGDAPDAQSQ